MITVLRGAPEAVASYILKEYHSSKDLVITGQDNISLPFTLPRLVLPLLRNHLTDNTVNSFLLEHKTELSLIFLGFYNNLSVEEKQERLLMAADLKSNITHSRVAKNTLIDHCAHLLVQLMGRNGLRLLIPDITRLDTGSLDVLRHMYQVYPELSPEIVFGYNTQWEPTLFDNNLGISWYHSLDSVTILQSFVHAFENKAILKKDVSSNVVLPSVNIEKTGFSLKKDQTDPAIDLQAWELVEAGPAKINKDEALLIFKAIQYCFNLFDFTNTLLLGLKSIHLIEPFLNRNQKGEIYHMMGLSAHNRHFFSQGNIKLAEFIETTLNQALNHEEDPARRIALLYRLIVTTSRRKSELSTAENLLNKAYKELATNLFNPFDKEILQAWIHNIHSFILMKKGHVKEAIAYHEKAYYLLENIHPNHTITKEEVAFTKAVLAENLATLHSLSGNFAAMEKWYALEVAYTKEKTSLNATSFAEWQSFYFQNLELQQALNKTYEGLAQSRDGFNYILEYFFTLSATDIHYKLGNGNETLKYLEKSFEFQKKLDYHYVTPYLLNILKTKTFLKLGYWKEALNLLKELRKDPEASQIHNSLNFNYLNAIIHVYRDQKNRAEEHINEAIHLALESGESGYLVKVCIAAGKICLMLNRNEEALDSFKKALEIINTSVNDEYYQPERADLANLYIGLYQSGSQNLHHLLQAIPSLAEALKKDADSWWNLENFLKLLNSLTIDEKIKCFEQYSAEIAQIEKAAKQRKDCKPYLDILKTPTANPLKI